MFKRIHPQAHTFLHTLGMCVLAFGLPMNKVLMSIGAIWGVSNLLLEGHFSWYWQNIKSNRLFLLLLSLFLVHLLGMLWSDDLSYGLDDIRKKLPLLAVPLALAARPLPNQKHTNWILLAFMSSLFLCSFLNLGNYLGWLGNQQTLDYRSMSLFGSHIRFSVLIAIGMALCIYLLKQLSKQYKPFLYILFIWFVLYTYYSQVMTGLLVLFGLLYFLLLYKAWRRVFLRSTLILTPLVGFSILLFYLNPPAKNSEVTIKSKLEKFTPYGNIYSHDTLSQETENGHLIYLYICDYELNEAWNKRSHLLFSGLDKKGQALRFTLYRYLTAKELRKDAKGVESLTEADIQKIEMGFTSPMLGEKGMKARLADIRYQLENRENPNGHSLLQRLEYWEAATQIIASNWLFGVGTGDVQSEFNHFYEQSHSSLSTEYRLRAHNMYLTFWVSFGLLGISMLLLFIFRFLQFNYEQKRPIAFLIMGIIAFSFFVEDTIETQTGVSLVALFWGLYIVPYTTSIVGLTRE